MNKSNKLYLKALNKYQSGYIDEAIDICEESISTNMKNRASLNLKGLLYYLKGDIDSANAIWKLNYEVNDDGVSKKYLQSLKEDEKKLTLYANAIGLIKELNIKEALEILMECKESDYNCINVDNAIATCYIKLGKYEKATEYVNKVLKIDKKNDVALRNKKELIKYGIKRKKFENNPKIYRKIITVLVLLLLCFAIGKFGIPAIKKVALPSKNQVDKTEAVQEKKNVAVKKTEPAAKKADEDKKKAEVEKKKAEVFPYEEIKNSLQKSDYNKLHEYVSKWKNANLGINNRTILTQSEEVLKKDGVKYFYTKGKEYLMTSKGYSNAIDNLLKAYLYGKDNYLYEHIIYVLGSCYEGTGDNESAIKYYSEYDNRFSKGSYEAEVLYRLALIYKEVNLEKAKEYASKLINNYPNSQYSNSIIRNIIKK
ncbi:tetratricopeptide repeat protein [Clostridium ganghwense]|uniref:Tetratricopeptide repeat protein n=1 Tax=Clostridium ganghwense TaxID=312089 RepID=A0ABT4CR36_9CLOT|nr:tetratricopeptide repeat protein [Clostridium ganghwense]MCY6371511.1 tetratricopeptide repeat protein [Clostridium ganghwense]